MQSDAERIIDPALRLDPGTRASIAELLLESLDVGEDFEVSDAWREEIRRRCAGIDSGAEATIEGDQALAVLRGTLAK